MAKQLLYTGYPITAKKKRVWRANMKIKMNNKLSEIFKDEI